VGRGAPSGEESEWPALVAWSTLPLAAHIFLIDSRDRLAFPKALPRLENPARLVVSGVSAIAQPFLEHERDDLVLEGLAGAVRHDVVGPVERGAFDGVRAIVSRARRAVLFRVGFQLRDTVRSRALASCVAEFLPGCFEGGAVQLAGRDAEHLARQFGRGVVERAWTGRHRSGIAFVRACRAAHRFEEDARVDERGGSGSRQQRALLALLLLASSCVGIDAPGWPG
jgi:hypothetical protein